MAGFGLALGGGEGACLYVLVLLMCERGFECGFWYFLLCLYVCFPINVLLFEYIIYKIVLI